MFCCHFVRRIIDGPLDVHPSRPAIVVHYEVEATVISEYGEPMVADRKQARKMYVMIKCLHMIMHSTCLI